MTVLNQGSNFITEKFERKGYEMKTENDLTARLNESARRVDVLVDHQDAEHKARMEIKRERTEAHFAATMLRATTILPELRGMAGQVEQAVEIVEGMRDCNFRRAQCENLLRDLGGYHGMIQSVEKLIEKISKAHDGDEKAWRPVDEFSKGALANLGFLKKLLARVVELAEQLPSVPVSKAVKQSKPERSSKKPATSRPHPHDDVPDNAESCD